MLKKILTVSAGITIFLLSMVFCWALCISASSYDEDFGYDE